MLTTMTDNSLIIIDELGRSTAVEEGTALAMAVCEELAKSKANVFVTTHFTLLTKLADMCLNVKVWQMETIPSKESKNLNEFRFSFKFSLAPGVTTLKGYGIYMVRNVFPRSTLKYAQELLRLLPEKEECQNFCKLDERVRLKYQLECKLHKLKEQNKLTVTEINNHLNQYQEDLRKLGQTFENYDDIIPQLSDLNHSIFDALSSEQTNLLNAQHPNDVNPTNEFQGLQMTSQISQISHTSSDNYMNSENHSRQYLPLVPQICLSSQESECSLNLTQNAFGLFGAIPDSHSESFPPSQISEEALSEVFKQIKHRDANSKPCVSGFKSDKNICMQPQPVLNNPVSDRLANNTDSGKELNDYQFSLPLNYDTTKTSTPLLTKFKTNARDFSSTSSSSICLNKEFNRQVNSPPKLNFTIINNKADNIDMESVQSDLESFVLNLEEDDDASFDIGKQTDIYNTETKTQNKKKEIKRKEDEQEIWCKIFKKANEDLEIINLLKNGKGVEANVEMSTKKNEIKTDEVLPAALTAVTSNTSLVRTISIPREHIFPIVQIVEGPNNSTPEPQVFMESDPFISSPDPPNSLLKSVKDTSNRHSKVGNAQFTHFGNNAQNLVNDRIKGDEFQNTVLFSEFIKEEQITENMNVDNDIEKNVLEKLTLLQFSSNDKLNNKQIVQNSRKILDNRSTLSLNKSLNIKKNTNALNKSIKVEPRSQNKSFTPNIEKSIKLELQNPNSTVQYLNTAPSQATINNNTEFAFTRLCVSPKLEPVSQNETKQSILNGLESTSATPSKTVNNLEKSRSADLFIDQHLADSLAHNIIVNKNTKICSNNVIENHKRIREKDGHEIYLKRFLSDNLVSSFYSIDESSNHPKDISNYFTATQESPVINRNKINFQAPFKKINILEDKIIQPPTSPDTKKVKLTACLSDEFIQKNDTGTDSNTILEDTYDLNLRKKHQEHNLSSSNQSSFKTVQEEMTLTSISKASKIRNLEDNCNTYSTSDDLQSFTNNPPDTKTDVSEVSKEINIDEVTSSIDTLIGKTTYGKQTGFLQCSPDSSCYGDPVPKKRNKKQLKPKKTGIPNKSGTESQQSTNSGIKKGNKKFVPPLKKIKKQLQKEDESKSTDFERIWKQRLNRSSVRQIKQIEYLATLVKTNKGIEIIPAEEKSTKNCKKRNNVKKTVTSTQSSVNMSIFNDKNAKSFNAFINSDQTNFRIFPFSLDSSKNKPKDGNLFNFQK